MHTMYRARWRALQAGLLAIALCAGALHAQPAAPPVSPVQTEVTREADGTRTLRQSVVAAAPAAAVWEALSSSAGWQSWAAPFALVDLRRGGMIETSYRPDARAGDAANIRNEIIALLPPRMMAIRNVQAPPSTAFDVPTFQSLHTVVLVESLEPQRTRITFAQPGYGEGAAFDGVLKHFTWGNAWTLEKLKERLERGPIDWAALMRPAAK